MRRHLILFVRAPAYGSGKRRLARDIGDLAALGFERLMLARVLRRLRRDRRWHLRIAVTPDRARYRQRVWPHGVPVGDSAPGPASLLSANAIGGLFGDGAA